MSFDLYLGASGSWTKECLEKYPQAAVLISRPYWRGATQTGIPWPNVMVDSGAFTYHAQGKETSVEDYLEFLDSIREVPQVRWAVSLDVIGNPEASHANFRFLQARGVQVIPVFHYGEPWDLLAEYCAETPYVGLGALVGKPKRDTMEWLDEVFARAWPHAFHLFGWGRRDVLVRYPFRSADFTSWTGPGRFGRFRAGKGASRLANVAGGGTRCYGVPTATLVPNAERAISVALDIESQVRLRWGQLERREVLCVESMGLWGTRPTKPPSPPSPRSENSPSSEVGTEASRSSRKRRAGASPSSAPPAPRRPRNRKS